MRHLHLTILSSLLWLVSALPLPASAHATLLNTAPENGVTLAESPAMISLQFNEPVSPVRVQLLDGNGNVITLTQALSEGNTLNYTPGPMPAEGQYLLSYRVLSEDAQPISGSIGFAVGNLPAPDASSLATADIGTVLLIRTVRTLLLITLLGSIGLVLYPLLFIQPAVLEPRRRKWLCVLCISGIVTAIIGLGLWGVLLADATPSAIFHEEVWTLANTTSLARSTVFAVLGLIMILLSNGHETTLATRLLGGAGALIAAVSLVNSGHAAGTPALINPLFLLHILMAGIWFGSLGMLLTLTATGPDKISLQVLKQFSSRATLMVIILLACAGIMSWYQLGSIGALFNSTYGRWLLLKAGLVSVILVLAILNRWRFTPALESGGPHARKQLHNAIRTETVIMVIVIAVTTVLASTPPPTNQGGSEAVNLIQITDSELNLL